MPQLYNYRLFISHAWDYHDSYTRFISFLDSAPNFIYSNYSAPRGEGFGRMSVSQLIGQLHEQIRPVQCVIILGGMYVAHSDWIQREIDYAKQLSKPILGVRPRGAQRMPQAVTDAAGVSIVGWNTSAIVDTIRGLVR